MSAKLRAVVNFTGADTDLSVTPLTELAVRKMNLVDNKAPVNVDFIASVNAQVAEAFGVTDMLDKVVAVNDANYSTESSVQAKSYGSLLGALSMLDLITESMDSTLSLAASHLQLVIDANDAVIDAKLSESLASGVALGRSVMDAYVTQGGGDDGRMAAAGAFVGYILDRQLSPTDVKDHFFATTPVFPV